MGGCNNAADWPGSGNPAEFRDGVAVRNTSDATKVAILSGNSSQTTGTRITLTLPSATGTLQSSGDAGTTSVNVGAKNGSTVTATEYGNSIWHQTVLTFTATPITMRDTEQGGGVKIYDFPAGRINIIGAVGSIAVTTTSALASTLNAGVTCNWGIGTVTQANATLATTEQNILTVANFTSSATINVAGAAAVGGVGASAGNLDGTSTAVDAFLNLAVAGATDIDGDATVTVTGSVTITWCFCGDQ
jgi:hypothetical protein